MGRNVTLFVVLLSTGTFFLIFNFITMITHHRKIGPRKWNTSNVQNGQILIEPVIEMPKNSKRTKNVRRPFHVAVTADDQPYSKWQCRIMHYWYKKKKDLPGSEMGKFTRILHSGSPDNLMDEIPTFVVDPLPEGLVRGYVVLNRPWAFVQWLEKAKIEEEYILMAEPDHIFLKPLPNLSYEPYPVAFPFFYIKPVKYEKIVRKFFPEDMGAITNVDPIGNSPVIIKKDTSLDSWCHVQDLLKTIAPTWMNVSLNIKNDPEADKTFGWVQEMYAYAVASALHGVQHILRKDFMLQPPEDLKIGNEFILHYTYGCNYNEKGEVIYSKIGAWRFDKRSYLDSAPPRNLTMPPKGIPETVVTLMKLLNEATSDIPNWDTFSY